ncbi:MAG: hypothetical protein M1833_002979 [Piccolia ochrophora]|nr:MAG: hypothetical protein M1833_002979 [Piccolia ochrophora]
MISNTQQAHHAQERDSSLEHRLISKYLPSGEIHCRRTLHQYKYPNLRNTQAQDADQHLLKRTGRFRIDEDSSNTVPDNDGTDFLFSSKEREFNDFHWNPDSHKQTDLRQSITTELQDELALRCDSSLDFVALVVQRTVAVLLSPWIHIDHDLENFRLFEESIEILTASQHRSSKNFQDRTNSPELDTGDSRCLLEWNHRSNSVDLSAFIELQNISDDIKTIETLLDTQHNIVLELIDAVGKADTSHMTNARRRVDEAYQTVKSHKDHVQRLLNNASDTQEAFRYLLDMKQK